MVVDDDDIIAEIKQQQTLNDSDDLLVFLTKLYPDHYFVIFEDNVLVTESFKDDDLLLTHKPEANGQYSYAIKQDDYAPIVIGVNRPPESISLGNRTFGLFWLPKNLITRSEQGQSLRKQINNHFTNSLVLLSLLAIVLSWLGAWYFLKPLKDIKQRFKALASGQLDTRIALKRNDEIGEIIVSFNQLANWLQTLHGQYKQMSSDLAHELKTPLTSMQSRIEALEDGLIAPDSQQYQLLLSDIKSINTIVEDLCLLTLTESKQLNLNMEKTAISKLTETVYKHFELQAQQRGIDFVLDIQSHRACSIDQQRLTQVLTNLIENAFKYGLDGNYIGLIVKETKWDNKDAIQISVHDKGKGLSTEQQQQVFDRFYRAQNARNDKHSLGLGLPICKQLTELMNGQLEVESELGSGCRFNVYFKIEK